MPATNADFCSSAAAFALRFRELHHEPNVLVLPNAWDVMSALVIANEGAAAIATTSGGVSWAHGQPDGQHLDRDRAIQAVSAIVDAVDLPVSADIEGGYGRAPDEVAGVVEQLISAGGCGINLEDSPGKDAPLLEPRAQVERIAAARAAARQSGVELVINARTDVFLVAGPRASLDQVLARAQLYAEAGADCLFVPGLIELESIRLLVARSPLPVNIMTCPGAPSVAQLAEAGVRRISVGTAIAQAAYSIAARSARELLTHGTYTSLDAELSYGALNALATHPATTTHLRRNTADIGDHG